MLDAHTGCPARLGHLEEAFAYSDASVGERRETPYIWLARGDVQLARKEKRADYCFDKALALAPKNWFVRWLAARVYAYYKKFALALKLVQEALSLNAAQGVLWLQLGFCQQALGLIGPARTSFDHARQFDAQSPAADAALRGLYQLGLWDKVRSRCQRIFHR